MFLAQMCVLLRLNPNSLCISDLQESSDSSNTTVEDEDVKGKRNRMRFTPKLKSSMEVFAVNARPVYSLELDNFWIITWLLYCINIIVIFLQPIIELHV